MKKIKINLSLNNYRREGVRKEIYVTIFALAILFSTYNIYKTFTLNSYNDGLSLKISELEKKVKKETDLLKVDTKSIKPLQEKVLVINDIIAKGTFSWVTLFSRLERAVPSKITVTRIIPNFTTKELSLNGIAKDYQKALSFVDKLGKSEYFSDAILLKHNEKDQIFVSADGRVTKGPKQVLFYITVKYEDMG